MNLDGDQDQASGSGAGGSDSAAPGVNPSGSTSGQQDTNGNLAQNLGARPKVRRNVISRDQVVPNENHENHEINEMNNEENEENNSEEDFYVYR